MTSPTLSDPSGRIVSKPGKEPKGPRHDGLCVSGRDWVGSGHCYCLCRYCWTATGSRGFCVCSSCPCGGWRNAASLGVFALTYQ